MDEFAFVIGLLGLLYIVLVCATDAGTRQIEAKTKALDAMVHFIQVADEKNLSDDFKKGLGDFICNDKSDGSKK
jgi:hypothetical protein|nr:MAG TPA: hypothetical protein [Caudoviricetes sp.]